MIAWNANPTPSIPTCLKRKLNFLGCNTQTKSTNDKGIDDIQTSVENPALSMFWHVPQNSYANRKNHICNICVDFRNMLAYQPKKQPSQRCWQNRDADRDEKKKEEDPRSSIYLHTYIHVYTQIRKYVDRRYINAYIDTCIHTKIHRYIDA